MVFIWLLLWPFLFFFPDSLIWTEKDATCILTTPCRLEKMKIINRNDHMSVKVCFYKINSIWDCLILEFVLLLFVYMALLHCLSDLDLNWCLTILSQENEKSQTANAVGHPLFQQSPFTVEKLHSIVSALWCLGNNGQSGLFVSLLFSFSLLLPSLLVLAWLWAGSNEQSSSSPGQSKQNQSHIPQAQFAVTSQLCELGFF